MPFSSNKDLKEKSEESSMQTDHDQTDSILLPECLIYV